MNDDWVLPKTIVLPSAVYQRCLGSLLGDLFSERDFLRLRDPPRGECTTDQIQSVNMAVAGMLVHPWWARQILVGREWNEELASLVVGRLLWLCDLAERHAYFRVDPRRLQVAIGKLPPAAKRRDDASESICLSLVNTYDYFVWVSQGGDSDLARWLARTVEQRLWA